jgi:hypothetical protein
MGTLKEETMFDDDESLYHVVAIGVRHCTTCHAVTAAFAFPACEEELTALRAFREELHVPLFAFRHRDEHRAWVHVFADCEEEVVVTPREFGILVRSYIEHHACASRN